VAIFRIDIGCNMRCHSHLSGYPQGQDRNFAVCGISATTPEKTPMGVLPIAQVAIAAATAIAAAIAQVILGRF
jgi:hypothetical protein